MKIWDRNNTDDDKNQLWLINNIKDVKTQSWKKKNMNMKVEFNSSRLPVRFEMNDKRDVLSNNARTIQIISKQVSLLTKNRVNSIVFIVTNSKGIVQVVLGSDGIIKTFDTDLNLGIGTSLTMEHAGVNAVSVAMELDEEVLVRGQEHSLKILYEWSCYCGPIRSHEGTCAYLEMLFPIQDDSSFAGLLFELVMWNIQNAILNSAPDLKREEIYKIFDSFSLTPREKEIGFGWLMNHSALRMAGELGIVEGTVRNILKKVYRKTGVSDKGQFFHRFMT